MSASPSSTRGAAASGSIPAAGPRANSRGSPSPSGTRSGTVGSATRQGGGRIATRATGSRALRTPQSSEQRGLPEQMDTESLPEVTFQNPFPIDPNSYNFSYANTRMCKKRKYYD